jgi:hypothetical protein
MLTPIQPGRKSRPQEVLPVMVIEDLFDVVHVLARDTPESSLRDKCWPWKK